MVRALCAVLLLAAASASAAPLALPNFEFAAAQIQTTVKTMRATQLQARSADIGPRLDAMAWDLQRAQQESMRMRDELRYLLNPVRSNQADPNIRWDFQRYNQYLSQLARDGQWRLNELRALSSQAQKDPNLAAPAQRLLSAAGWLKNETNWLTFDVRFAYFDLMRAGLTFEGMDLDRNSRDFDQNARDLNSEAERLLAKVR